MYNLAEIFAFGSPNGLLSNKYSQDLLGKIIEEKNFLHSCLDYDGSLQKISLVAKNNNLSVKLISKIYLNYPDLISVRRKSLLDQIIAIRELFGDNDLELIPQISSVWELPNNGYKSFLEKLYFTFGIKRILVEVFPDTKNKSLLFIRKLNNELYKLNMQSKISIGISTYENKDTYGIDSEIMDFINLSSLEIAPLRILGAINNEDDIVTSLENFLELRNHPNFFRGVTKVSTESHYYELFKNLKDLLEKQTKNKREKSSSSITLISLKQKKASKNPYGLNKSKIKQLKFYFKQIFKLLFLFKKKRDLNYLFKIIVNPDF